MSAGQVPLHPLPGAGAAQCVDVERLLPARFATSLPRSLRVLFENAAWHAPQRFAALFDAHGEIDRSAEIDFFPGRVLMHDTTCLPALADFAAMRDAVAALGGDAARVNPVIPVDLVIDHSITVEHYGSAEAAARNLEVDFRRNAERYRFVKWAQKSLANFRVMPPGSGILHQLNLEHLAQGVCVRSGAAPGGADLLLADTLVGTDSHTPMINALGTLGWGVGGVEAQAAMLGEPLAMTVPRVIGVRLEGRLPAGVMATDLALHVTQMLRAHGVIGCFVEFCGPGVSALSVADRATVSNMAPEYGATCAYFPIDTATLDYLRVTGRSDQQVARIEMHARLQRLWLDPADPDPQFDVLVQLDLDALEPVVAGPRYPHERKQLAQAREDFMRVWPTLVTKPDAAAPDSASSASQSGLRRFVTTDGTVLEDGAVVLAAITSCTNTSNPALLIGAGLLARNARQRGLARKPWVKTSLSPGSRVVAGYLDASGLQQDLDALGFHVAGLGCMTCIGNSGALEPAVIEAVDAHGMCAIGVLSGNRNFDGRVNGHLAGAYLASPPLVVAWAIAGTLACDLLRDPLGNDPSGRPVYLRELWPRDEEIQAVIDRHLAPAVFRDAYDRITEGPPQWQAIDGACSTRFGWDPDSDYIRRPPYFDALAREAPGLQPLSAARVLLKLGDNVTTDHISPAGTIPAASVAGRYLLERGTAEADLNQYSTRRSNHEVLLRGAFSNRRLRNEYLAEGSTPPGGHTWDISGTRPLPVYAAVDDYRRHNIPLVILAGRNYGAGSSRDWAAKAPALLGVRAVIAESYERIHRSNLIALGVLPLCYDRERDPSFYPERARDRLCTSGLETLHFEGVQTLRVGRNELLVNITNERGVRWSAPLVCELYSRRELEYLVHGGVLPRVVRRFAG